MLGYLERRSQVTSFFFLFTPAPPLAVREVETLELTGLGVQTAPCAKKKQAEITRSPDLDLPPPPHEDVVLIPHVSLQAILVLDSPDVDLRLWNETVAEMEASGK